MSTTYQTITVEKGQTLFDATLQLCGSLEGLFDILILNNLTIDDELVAGTELKVSAPTDKITYNVINGLGIVPATLETPPFVASGNDAVVIKVASAPSNLSTTVEVGQTIFDIAVQLHGTLEGLFDVIQKNNSSITGTLTPGTLMVASSPIEQGVRSGIQSLNIIPCTEYTVTSSSDVIPEGVDYWAIEIDFKVS